MIADKILSRFFSWFKPWIAIYTVKDDEMGSPDYYCFSFLLPTRPNISKLDKLFGKGLWTYQGLGRIDNPIRYHKNQGTFKSL